MEAVADAVAILDRGRVVRAAETETLQREVKRVVLMAECLGRLPRPAGLLDLRVFSDHVAVTLDDAEAWVSTVRGTGFNPEVQDLSLDEIFEAFVIGQKDAWPDRAPSRRAAIA